MPIKQTSDVIIVGAGAAGLMCAIEAGKRGRTVQVIDRANMPGKKILMSGGGRCNFTNYHIHPDAYISHNPHFCKSALSRYTQWDFIELVQKHQIAFHEKALGQLFCDNKSKDILQMLLKECEQVGVKIVLNVEIESVQAESGFEIKTNQANYSSTSLVVASGGLSIPTLGSSPFAYRLAEQFKINVWPTRAGLVPLTLHQDLKEKWAALSGIGLPVSVSNEHGTQFKEDLLFTHRGLSGPAILQISSYWQGGEAIVINLLPQLALSDFLKTSQQQFPQRQLNTQLSEVLPRRVIDVLLSPLLAQRKLATISHRDFDALAESWHAYCVFPNGTEGYRTAEVTLGGVDCDAISSKTMEVKTVPGLYFIGEALDVTGWLGGYNFQWAWSSGWAAGQVV